MSTRRPEVADLAVAGGVVLLLASFLPWYGLDAGTFRTDGGQGGPRVTAWQTPAWWVPVLTGVALAGIWAVRLTGRIAAHWLPAVSVALGLVGVALVLAQLMVGPPVSDFGWFAYVPAEDGGPGDFGGSVRVGLLLGLLGLVAQTAASAVVLRRRTPG